MIRRLRDLIRYRELIRNLVVRNLKVRYKNSVLGILWSLLNPLLMTLVFTLLFTFMMPNQIDRFPVFFMCGFLPWSFFATSLTASTGSVVNSGNLIKKVYFPREILPLVEILSALVNFLLALVVLFVMLLVFRFPLRPALILLPFIILTQVIFTLGMGLLLSTANVFYRDTQHILEVVITAWFFLTPIFYSITTLPEQAIFLGVPVDVRVWMRRLNPMASLVASYQDVLYWGHLSGIDFFLRTVATCLAVLAIGYVVFCRFSPSFGEEV